VLGNVARTWDASTWEEWAVITGGRGGAFDVTIAPDSRWLSAAPKLAAAPDGTWLAAVSSSGTLRSWDTATGQAHCTLKGRTGHVTSMVLAPDGRWLATNSYQGTVRIWDTLTWRALALMRTENRIRDAHG
jgi:WD40 repeat protein